MFWTVLTVALTLLYPLAIWLGHGQLEPRWLACVLLLAAATRLPALRISGAARWSVAGALVLVALAVWSNVLLPLKLYPVLVNMAFLAAFGFSLATPVSMIERLARLREPDLPPEGVAYTRRVTQAWCVFFVVNGSLALVTALWASEAVWSLYNGVIAYGLMGLMFGGELLLRRRVRKAVTHA
ncbi:membrane protein [Pseudoduganella violaceinigra]|uniref:COG4648 family protein n=1 Tax=Pseudoduganella violaceinigra TaxID=246602 RepID=UPI000428859C|nr:membrane protein [Pseudoduganella violaceinigra]